MKYLTTGLTTVENRTNPEAVWSAFESNFEPKSNFRLARFRLRELKQDQNEPVDSFLTRLRQEASKCNFTSIDNMEDNILDQLIKRTSHSQVRKKLDCSPNKLTLDNALDMART